MKSRKTCSSLDNTTSITGVPRKSAYISLGVDHRVLDGALPMKFMHEVLGHLMNPRLLIKD